MQPMLQGLRTRRIMLRASLGRLRAASPRGGLSRDLHPLASVLVYGQARLCTYRLCTSGGTQVEVSEHEARTEQRGPGPGRLEVKDLVDGVPVGNRARGWPVLPEGSEDSQGQAWSKVGVWWMQATASVNRRPRPARRGEVRGGAR